MSIQLRDYQVRSIEAMRENARSGHTRQVLCAATGAGKSVMMVDVIRSAVEKGSRTLFICERRVLVEQFSKHLDSMGIDHGVLMAKHWRFRPEALVQVASVQTLERMDSWPAFDIVFIDELHACMRKSVLDLIERRPQLRIIGATATPFHPEIARNFSAVTSVVTMEELVASGALVPFRVFVAHEIDTNGLKVVAGEWKKDDLEKRGQLIVGDIVSDYVRLSNDVFGEYRKTICFSCGVDHGTDLVNRFSEAGINAVQITYKDSDEFKADVLEDFAKHDTSIKVVISSDILTRGYDQTDVEHVILARPLKKSFSTHVQMVGRGARPHHGKQFCVIQDNAGNWLRFKDSWDTLYSDGVKELASDVDLRPRKEPTAEQKEASRCPKCHSLWPRFADVCPSCGFTHPRRSEIVDVPGKLEELSGQAAEKYSGAVKEQWYQELLGYARNRGFNDGWSFHKYMEKFGVQPKWAKVPKDPGVEVLNYIKSRAIAYAKRRIA